MAIKVEYTTKGKVCRVEFVTYMRSIFYYKQSLIVELIKLCLI